MNPFQPFSSEHLPELLKFNAADPFSGARQALAIQGALLEAMRETSGQLFELQKAALEATRRNLEAANAAWKPFFPSN